MKRELVFFLVLAVAFTGCKKEALNPGIRLDKSSECKDFNLKTDPEVGQDKDCIFYSYQDNILTIRHVNAGYNCCPEGFIIHLEVKGDTLLITEKEKSSLCDCNCLFDLDYTLSDIRKGTWWIRVDEQYIQTPEQEKILFEVDLKNEPEGQFCVQRDIYPWRI